MEIALAHLFNNCEKYCLTIPTLGLTLEEEEKKVKSQTHVFKAKILCAQSTYPSSKAHCLSSHVYLWRLYVWVTKITDRCKSGLCLAHSAEATTQMCL